VILRYSSVEFQLFIYENQNEIILRLAKNTKYNNTHVNNAKYGNDFKNGHERYALAKRKP